MRRIPAAVLPILTLLGSILPRLAQAEELSKSARSTLLKGVVFLLAQDRIGGRLEPVSSGTGTVISKDGWILTNFHVVYDYNTATPHEVITVGFTRSPKEKPEMVCMASADSGLSDRNLDIALIKCDRDMAGNPLPKSRTFTPVPIGDSDAVEIGDEIHVIGYPGVGGETITFTSGKISGFIGEDGRTAGDRWFKTEADLAPGNSGGAAVNSKGELIGIPTMIHYDSGASYGYSYNVSRTNLVRPIKYAREFIDGSLNMKSRSKTVPLAFDTDGVTIIGKLLSADTGDPIAGAVVLFLKPGVRVRDVTMQNVASKLFTRAVSDEEGDFRTDIPLARGRDYGVWIIAEGFQSLLVDKGIETGLEGASLYDVGPIEMQRKKK